MVQLVVPDVGQQADLVGGLQQVDVVDLLEVVRRVQVLSPLRGGHGDVEEVRQVEPSDAETQLADRLVPKVVQRGIEQPGRSRREHLADVERPAALLDRQMP
ncbi:hypothetical protein ACQPX6_19975 [Actinomycetospora sp. CA-101289]|uniref:hypothetical protein n=1 Tax=Actinomycetospora sp. CA-101289 TaxID=3239893 RepID=UPI003D955731